MSSRVLTRVAVPRNDGVTFGRPEPAPGYQPVSKPSATPTMVPTAVEVPKLVAATVNVSPRDIPGHDHHAQLTHHPDAFDPGAISR
jgi:hypothetical protein